MMPSAGSWLIAILAAVPWATGCSNRHAVPISEGVVLLDGRPLTNVAIDLMPVAEDDPPISGAVSDEEGRFRLRSRGRGRYTVVVTDGERDAGGSRVPRRYMNPRTSPLEVVLPLEAPLTVTLERE